MATGLDRRSLLRVGVASIGASACRSPPKAPIIVVGAGMAGLWAAHRLVQAGRRVVVLEAAAIPGGRVRTVRDFPGEDFVVEAGAARIADTHRLALAAVEAFGLALAPFEPPDLSELMVCGGRRATDIAGLNLQLSSEERPLSAEQLLQHYLEDLPANLGEEAVFYGSSAWAGLDRLSWPDWLASRGASSDAVKFLTLGGDSREVSALFVLHQLMLHRNVGGFYRLADGMDVLPKAIAASLGDVVRFGATVTDITQRPDGVSLRYATAAGATQLVGARVVIAVPLAALSRIRISPPLTLEKQGAMQQLDYFPTTRLHVQTRGRRWMAPALSGFARTDAPAEIWNATFDQPGTGGVVTVTVGGELSQAPGGGDAGGVAARILASAFPDAGAEVMRITAHRWADDGSARGAFVRFAPGQMCRLAGALPAQEGRLHFAGEHTAPHMSWIEGALQSAVRVTTEIEDLR